MIPGAEIEWKSIRVPGNWEFQGFGEALYVNQPYEFEPYHPKAPVLPDVIPMGVYHRTFTIPEEWAGRRIYLNFDAVKSGVFVYMNGRRVGYSEDSKDRAQFCINDFVKEGENDLVVKCYRWSTGSWLECQDFWRVSGIERDVYLSSEAKDSIFDFDVVSTLDETCSDGLFKLQVAGGDISKVSYKLLDASGKTVLEGVPGQDTIRIPGVRFWSAETPELYTLIIRDHDEYIPFRVGFVRYEFLSVPGDDSHIQFCVNGRPVIYKGVNLHETDSETGHYVTEEDLRRDFELMLSMNINAVRTSHYPQSRRFYELAAEYGIYVYNEANIESHGMGYNLAVGGTLANNPAFLESHLDRIEALYNTTRNYPCVNIWSLGNEAGNGYNMYQAYLWLKRRDPSRPVTYERAQWEWNADIYTRQYPDAPWYEEMGRN
ncbi:MAG: hypothetical protein HUJ93_04650 [Bacteroidales bacterium]|nr:hypothetical protein [Bacteroidales bacterium]